MFLPSSTALFALMLAPAPVPPTKAKIEAPKGPKTLILYKTSVACTGRYKEAVERAFKACRGVKSFELRYVAYAPEHGPQEPCGGLTARVTVVLEQRADAKTFSRAISALGFETIELLR